MLRNGTSWKGIVKESLNILWQAFHMPSCRASPAFGKTELLSLIFFVFTFSTLFTCMHWTCEGFLPILNSPCQWSFITLRRSYLFCNTVRMIKFSTQSNFTYKNLQNNNQCRVNSWSIKVTLHKLGQFCSTLQPKNKWKFKFTSLSAPRVSSEVPSLPQT